ncbi:hypothetical protein DFH28DRAFT_978455 [Melampsora americana]|nr:hypothetical protein DFH28DRAFT_978455 [Melampsora americana]
MIDGLIFLKSYFEEWRNAEIEKLIKIQKINFNASCKILQPSVLLRYLMQIPTSTGRNISINMLWGMWVAWSKWNGSKILHKTYIGSFDKFLNELAKAADAKLIEN